MVILEAYADLPMPDGSGSMSLKGWEAGGFVYNFLGTITYPPQNAGTFLKTMMIFQTSRLVGYGLVPWKVVVVVVDIEYVMYTTYIT